MFTLTDVEKELLLKSSDPAIVAATQKLIKAEADGEFVPKSRLSEVSKAKKELEEKLKKFEDDQKAAEEEKARKSGELDKLYQAEKTARAAAEAKLAEETKVADQHRAHLKSTVEAVKKQLGDKWLPEFENFSLESLMKLPGVDVQKIGVLTGAPVLPADKYFTREQIEAMPESEMKGKTLEKVNASLEYLKTLKP
jgi:hypothetical protein